MLQTKYIVLLFTGFILFLSSCGAKKKSGTLASSAYKGSVSTASKTTGKENRTSIVNKYAGILGVSSGNLNIDLYTAIDDWMGIPHRLGGLTREGIDCSAFVGLLYRQVYGKDLPRTSRDMADIVKRKYDTQLKEGDLVFFSFSGKNIDHVGIYLHNDKFVHVSTTKGVIISNLKDQWFYKYFTRCGTPNI